MKRNKQDRFIRAVKDFKCRWLKIYVFEFSKKHNLRSMIKWQVDDWTHWYKFWKKELLFKEF